MSADTQTMLATLATADLARLDRFAAWATANQGAPGLDVLLWAADYRRAELRLSQIDHATPASAASPPTIASIVAPSTP